MGWKVNFRSIAFEVFGREVAVKRFDEGTSRIWLTTYLDEEMRIVRAGPTESEAQRLGSSASVEDYFIFVMTREGERRIT